MGVVCCKEVSHENGVEKLDITGALTMAETGPEEESPDDLDVVRDIREHGEPEPEKVRGPPDLRVGVVGARGLWPSDWQPGASDPACYCEVVADGKVLFATAKSETGYEPVWGGKAVDVALPAAKPPLEFVVHDGGSVGHDILGKARLETEDYQTEGFNGELQLKDAKAGEACIRVKVQLADRDLPPGPAASFKKRFEKPKNAQWGVVFDSRDEVQLRVKDITDGIISEYNSKANPHEQLNVGDYLMEVNGKSGNTDALLAEFRTTHSVDCVVSRPVTCTFLVDFGEASDPKGLDIVVSPNSDFWVIKSTAKDGKGKGQFLPSDRIIALSSTKDLAVVLPQKIAEAIVGRVLVTVQRPAAGSGKGSPSHWAFE
eukprot:CAMPEP_0175375684 /NCGR_PEP_ID=MMETSP0095-20121207/23889_1 /TAXON_ID=311494 /ORGANISM="Alexandrium monilatum, Strain CCMP3105" /LENGTH=372 /DNA_ID=CAMNT_0016673949 /DNA_START=74 /DNA_END=1192 /DNA_ORIENTATION=-